MEGKFKTWEKCLELGDFFAILVSGICKGIFVPKDIGALIMMMFSAILVFCILTVVALFPATWRMTDKQKKKIEDLDRYQDRYRSGWVIVNFVWSMIMVILMIAVL